MLYDRGKNGDTDDAEYYVNHLVFAVLPELDGDILYTVLSFKAAPRWLRHDGMRRWRDCLRTSIFKNNRLDSSEGLYFLCD